MNVADYTPLATPLTLPLSFFLCLTCSIATTSHLPAADVPEHRAKAQGPTVRRRLGWRCRGHLRVCRRDAAVPVVRPREHATWPAEEAHPLGLLPQGPGGGLRVSRTISGQRAGIAAEDIRGRHRQVPERAQRAQGGEQVKDRLL